MTVVPYHIEQGGRYYSFSFLHDTIGEARQDCAERDSYTLIRSLNLDQQYYGVYTANRPVKPRPLDPDYSKMSDSTAAIIEVIIHIFEYIDMEQPLEWYKEPNIQGIVAAIDRVQWRERVHEVGGQLISNLVLKHPLPNANHRSAIALLQVYFETFDENLSVPKTNTGDEWTNWTNEFIGDSKQLLTVRRNANSTICPNAVQPSFGAKAA